MCVIAALGYAVDAAIDEPTGCGSRVGPIIALFWVLKYGWFGR